MLHIFSLLESIVLLIDIGVTWDMVEGRGSLLLSHNCSQ